MTRLRFAAAGVVLLAGLAWAVNGSGAGEEKDPSIKAIMTKAHKGGNSLLATVRKDLMSDETNWADVQKKTKELVKLGTALGKNEPPRGDKESWAKLTGAYVENAKALDAAVGKQQKDEALKEQMKLAGRCMECHKAHRKP
jgi:hypothetical protein